MSKIYAGLQVLQGSMTVKLNNLSAMECNVVRPFFQGSLGQFQALAGVCASAPPLAIFIWQHEVSTDPELVLVGDECESLCTRRVFTSSV